MSALTARINRKLSSLLSYDPVTKLKIQRLSKMESIGTEYGGWTIPQNFLKDNSICYLAGAGEDISFDIGLAEKYGSQVYIFDPTPKAVRHFEGLKEAVDKGTRFSINNSESEFYLISKENLSHIHFIELGLWDKEETLKFYVPKSAEHASYSILNIQKTESYINARVDRLSHIMQTLGHVSIDLLKIDVEGSEYKVLQTIMDDNLIIPVLCVEYDEAIFAIDEKFITRIKNSLQALMDFGYVLVDCSESCNYTLMRREILNQ